MKVKVPGMEPNKNFQIWKLSLLKASQVVYVSFEDNKNKRNKQDKVRVNSFKSN